jgi:hypothetical protein
MKRRVWAEYRKSGLAEHRGPVLVLIAKGAVSPQPKGTGRLENVRYRNWLRYIFLPSYWRVVWMLTRIHWTRNVWWPLKTRIRLWWRPDEPPF